MYFNYVGKKHCFLCTKQYGVVAYCQEQRTLFIQSYVFVQPLVVHTEQLFLLQSHPTHAYEGVIPTVLLTGKCI